MCPPGLEAGPVRFPRLSLGWVSCQQMLRPSCPKGHRAFPQPHPVLHLALKSLRCLPFPTEPLLGSGLAGGSPSTSLPSRWSFPLQRKACCTGHATSETRTCTSEHRRWAPPAVAGCQTFKPLCMDSHRLPTQQRSKYEPVTLPLAAERGTTVLSVLT